MSPEAKRVMIRAIDKLVSQGKAEHVLVDGKPGLRLVDKDKALTVQRIGELTGEKEQHS